jgi:hypothetical protein
VNGARRAHVDELYAASRAHDGSQPDRLALIEAHSRVVSWTVPTGAGAMVLARAYLP